MSNDRFCCSIRLYDSSASFGFVPEICDNADITFDAIGMFAKYLYSALHTVWLIGGEETASCTPEFILTLALAEGELYGDTERDAPIVAAKKYAKDFWSEHTEVIAKAEGK